MSRARAGARAGAMLLPACAAIAVASLFVLAGCSADRPLNPSFPLTLDDAKAALKSMAQYKAPLPRPVIVVGGYRDIGLATGASRKWLRRTTVDPRITVVTMFTAFTFDGAAERLVEAVEQAYPSGDSQWTTEVDVIAISMGGLVTRYAAMDRGTDGDSSPSAPTTLPAASAPEKVCENLDPAPSPRSGGEGWGEGVPWDQTAAPLTLPSPPPSRGRGTTQTPTAPSPSPANRKRLRIARLFTISTPHRGANLAPVAFFDSLAIDMRPGCAFLARLDAALPDAGYELFPYVRLNDEIVGEENAAPPGMTAWWVQNQPGQCSHLNCGRDERILADILRRLRGEEPFTRRAPAGLPSGK